MHGEIVHGFEELAVVASLVAASRPAGPETSIAMAQSSSVIRVSMVDLAESRPAMNHRNRRKGIPIRFPHG